MEVNVVVVYTGGFVLYWRLGRASTLSNCVRTIYLHLQLNTWTALKYIKSSCHISYRMFDRSVRGLFQRLHEVGCEVVVESEAEQAELEKGTWRLSLLRTKIVHGFWI